MNYSHYSLERREEELERRSVFTLRRTLSSLLRMFFAVVLVILVVGICGGSGIIAGCIASAPDVSEISIAPSGYATLIYDSEGNQLQKLTSSNSNRTAVSLDKVPTALQHAVVAIEDERFYDHNGIDPKGILRAVFIGIKSGFHFSEGASTITQQLLKNNVFTGWMEEKSLVDRAKRKFQEQYLALELERKLHNKDLILENYLNTINMGAGTYGVQAASKKYFNKDVSELTLSECTVLAGITQNPSRYNPIRHPDYNAQRRERVLNKMVEQGYITARDMENALADNVYERIEEAQLTAAQVDTVYSYFIDALTEDVVADLQTKLGCSETQAYQMLYSGGLRIYTTQDRRIQKICDEEYNDPSNFPEGTTYSLDWALTVAHVDGTTKNYSREMLQAWFRTSDPEFSCVFNSEEEGTRAVEQYKAHILEEGDTITAERMTFSPQPQSSLVIMDQYTGYVKAIEGGRGKKTASLTLNRATDSYRQPGSTFKILSTYAPAFESGLKTLGSVERDEPYSYSTGDPIRNAGGNYNGTITLREAITYSANVVAVKVLQQISPAAGYQQLLKFGITSLDPVRDVVEPLALGGISKGVSNIELTAAYAAIANGGTYIKPIFYSKILDQYDNVILSNEPEKHEAIGADTAWLLTSAMMDVVTSGTGTEVFSEDGPVVAGKTGTTNDYRNVWFVGFTTSYTMGVWGGYDNNQSLPDDDVSKNFHKRLWKKIIGRVTEGQYKGEFRVPDTVERAELCGISGQRAGYDCEYTTEDYISSRFAPGYHCQVCGNWHEYDYDDHYYDNTNDDGGGELIWPSDTGGQEAAGGDTGGDYEYWDIGGNGDGDTEYVWDENGDPYTDGDEQFTEDDFFFGDLFDDLRGRFG